MSPKRTPKKRRVPPRRAPKRSKTPKRRARRKAPGKKRSARARSEAAKRGWATRKKRARALARERDSDKGDVEIPKRGRVPKGYRAYPHPQDRSSNAAIERLAARKNFRRVGFKKKITRDGEIEWFPRFDEVYDYIDALVDEYDLDAHELFELAYGYADEAVA